MKKVCKYCFIEARSLPRPVKMAGRGTPVDIPDDYAPDFVHINSRDEAGNPACGRQFLKGDDLIDAQAVEEA